MRETGAAAAWFRSLGTNRAADDDIRAKLRNAGIHLSMPDDKLPERNGIVCFAEINDELLEFLRQRRRHGGEILALAAIPSALPAGGSWKLLHAGAADVLAWHEGANLAGQIRAKLERWAAIDELAGSASSHVALVGESTVSRTLLRRVVEAARYTDAPILLIGESGTGKELLARLVHLLDARRISRRDSTPDLITVDCSTIVAELSGSELFGHERGAFTGAIGPREGAFALADGGTLFLDEIGELPLKLQTHLLRAVQEKTYKRVGGNVWQTSDFRLVCATNRDLNELVSGGQFRLDLFHRIAGWVFHTPALRDRREDILPLALQFLNGPSWPEPLDFDDAVREYLVNRIYPGNVRELRQLVQRIAHRHIGPGPVTIGDIPEDDRPAGPSLQRAWPDDKFESSIAAAVALGAGLKEITQATSETAIRIAVQSEKGNLQRAAKRLGITDRALQMRRASGKIPLSSPWVPRLTNGHGAPLEED